MSLNTYNIVIAQNTTKNILIQYLDSDKQEIDITNYTAELQVRSSYTSATALITLTTAINGGLTIQNTNEILIKFLPVHTQNLTLSKYVYDIMLLSPAGVQTRILAGEFVVSKSVVGVL